MPQSDQLNTKQRTAKIEMKYAWNYPGEYGGQEFQCLLMRPNHQKENVKTV